jgi:Fe2+ or Zn2+ uptake regulation protein
MNQDKAGCVEGTRKNGQKKGCAHQRMVDDHCNEQGTKTGHLVCRECGAVIHESVKA